jgi:hypothetical protein
LRGALMELLLAVRQRPRITKLLLTAGRSGRASTSLARSGGPASLAATTTTTEVRLQQMCQRVHIAQLATLDAEEVSIRRTAAAVGISSAERAEHHDRADRRVHHEAAVGDVHAARDADIAAVHDGSITGVRAAFCAVAGVTPRDKVLFTFKERIEVGVGCGDQCVARILLSDGNGSPLLGG